VILKGVGTFEANDSQQLFDAVMQDSDRLGISRTAALDAMLMETILHCRWNYPHSKGYGIYTAMAALLVSNGANPGIIIPDSQGNNLLQVTLNEMIRQLDISLRAIEHEERKKRAWSERNLAKILYTQFVQNSRSFYNSLKYAFGGFSRKGEYGNFRECQLLETLLKVDVPINHKNRASLTLRDLLGSIKKSKYSVVQEIIQEMVDHFNGLIMGKEDYLNRMSEMLSMHMPGAHVSLVCEYLNLITPRSEVRQVQESDDAIVGGAQDIAARNNAEDGNEKQNKRCKYMTEKLISCPIL